MSQPSIRSLAPRTPWPGAGWPAVVRRANCRSPTPCSATRRAGTCSGSRRTWGWRPDALGGPEYVIVSTLGGIRAEDGRPIALGYHTGHWEVGLLVREAAEALRGAGAVPFAAFCSDPCDGRTQGTDGMFDSLAYRNDAATVMRRLIRSLPTASGVMGIATCD